MALLGRISFVWHTHRITPPFNSWNLYSLILLSFFLSRVTPIYKAASVVCCRLPGSIQPRSFVDKQFKINIWYYFICVPSCWWVTSCLHPAQLWKVFHFVIHYLWRFFWLIYPNKTGSKTQTPGTLPSQSGYNKTELTLLTWKVYLYSSYSYLFSKVL